MTLEITPFTLDEALALINSATLSRAAVETSTPEQIVWLTAEAIADRFRSRSGWVPSATDRAERAVLDAIGRCGLGPAATKKVLSATKRALTGWPE